MKRVLAIAQIAIRNAIRSRVVLVLMAMLLLAIIGLPLTVKGDGTLPGQVQILLSYTLSVVAAILSIATVWAGCAAISSEVQTKQIHLMVTKPVHRVEIWLGKWLGLLVLNAVLLALAGAVIYGMLRWNTRASRLSEEQQRQLAEEILVARRVVRPEPIDVTADAQKYLEERRAKQALPPDQPVEQVLEAIKGMMLMQAYAVPTGFKRDWRIDLPAAVTTTRPLLFRYRFSSSQLKDAKVAGVWLVGKAESPERTEVRVLNVAEGLHTFSVPASVAAGTQTLVVEYANVNPEPMAVLFDPKDGLQLLVYEGTFEGNLVRSLLVVFCQLVFLGALAVSAGTLTSLPVAALLTGYLVLLIKIGGYLETLSKETGAFFAASPQPGAAGRSAAPLLDALLRGVVAIQSWMVRPLQSGDPLSQLTAGELVDWTWVSTTFVIKVLIYSGILAVITAWLFDRREIGTAT